MKHKLFLISCLLISFNLFAQKLPPVIQWQRSLGGSKADKAEIVIRTVDNGYLVAGQSFSNDGDVSGHHGSTDSSDAWVVKLNANGVIQWQRSVGGSGTDLFTHAIQAPNGDFLCVGSTTSNDGDVTGLHNQSRDAWVCRINSSGALLWSKVYGGSGPDKAQGIRKINSGYVIGGETKSNDFDVTGNSGAIDMWVFTINESGTRQWQKCFGNVNDNRLNDLRVASNGDYLLAGYEQWVSDPICDPQNMENIYLGMYVRMTPNGNIISRNYPLFFCGGQTYGASNHTHNLLELPSGRVVFLGQFLYSQSPTSTGYMTMGISRLPPEPAPYPSPYYGGLANSFSMERTMNGTPANSSDIFLPDSSIVTTLNGAYSATVAPRVQARLVSINTRDSARPSSPNDRYYFANYSKEFGGSNNDYFKSVAILNEIEYIVAGYSNSNDGDVSGNHGDYDFWVVKFQSLNRVVGRVFLDNNNNGIKDAGENYLANAKVTSTKAGQSVANITGPDGRFLNHIDTGTYVSSVSFPNRVYFTATPVTKTTSFTTYKNTDSFDFAATPIPGKKDLMISLAALDPIRAARQVRYKLFYTNLGTATVNNVTVKVVKSPLMGFDAAVPQQSVIQNDTIIWNIAAIAPADTGSIIITLKAGVPPQLNFLSVVQLHGSIEPIAGDEYPADNKAMVSQGVSSGFDPNDKNENFGGRISPSQLATDYLTYTIRFQNTGNDTTFNIVVTDTLENKLNWSSFEMVSASHKYHLSVKDGNKFTWKFENVLLVDSNTNEPASHGYITYRIRPVTSLNPGDTIKNSASIYFDYNLPVLTNTQRTVVKNSVEQPAVSGIATTYCSTQALQKGKINNLPSPAASVSTTVKLDGNALTIATDSTFTFDVSALAGGAHVIDVTYSSGAETKTTTLNFNVTVAVSPDVNVGANITTAVNLIDPVIITASNAAGGGTTPLYAFAKDRNFTNIVQAEGTSNVLNIAATSLQTGDNWYYVRMKTSATCFTTQFNIDSIKISLQLPAPNQPVLTGLKTQYCINDGAQKVKLANYSAIGTGTTVNVKLDGNAVTLNMADTSFSFALATGNHTIDVTYTNPTATKTTTANFTVNAAATPVVNITANNFTLTANNAAGGGTVPLYTFAKDRNFTSILQAESASASFTLNPNLGGNKVYVRMRTSLTCYTQQTAIDSITITRYSATGLIDPDYPNQTIGATPNPFRSRLMISGLSMAKSYTIIIYNQRGTVVEKRKVTGVSLTTLYLPVHASGSYLVSIYDETKNRIIGTMEIVKQ